MSKRFLGIKGLVHAYVRHDQTILFSLRVNSEVGISNQSD